MENNGIWSDNRLMATIDTFGYQMAELGRQNAYATDARMNGDYDVARMHDARAELYRVAAYELKKDINAQIVLRGSNALIAP